MLKFPTFFRLGAPKTKGGFGEEVVNSLCPVHSCPPKIEMKVQLFLSKVGCVPLMLVFCLSVSALTWDFESQNQMDDWEAINGEWEIQNGKLLGTQENTYIGVVACDVGWEDYILAVKWERTVGPYTYLMVRVQEDPLSYYTIEISGSDNNVKVFRRDAGQHTNLFPGKPLADADVQEYEAEITVEKKDIIVVINGEEITTVTDSKYAAGRIGVGGYASSNAFDEITVEGPGIPPSAVTPGGKLATTWGTIKRHQEF